MVNQIEIALARYINLKNAVSIALTILITILMSNIEQKSLEEIAKYTGLIVILFIMWIVVYSIEKGGVDFVQWLASFFEKRQSNNVEIETARIAFAKAINISRTESLETKVGVQGYQIPPPGDERPLEVKQINGYQKPGA